MAISATRAHRAPGASSGLLALSLAASMLVTPLGSRAWAAPPAEAGGEVEPAEPAADTEGSAPEISDETNETLQPEVTEVEQAPPPTGGGVAGAIVDPDDPNAGRAQSDLEGESLDDQVEGVPERLPKLQAAGWWTTFSAVALATAGGVFAGVSEARQDEAERLAYAFDLETGRASLYADVADDYEKILSQGETFQWLARGFIIAGGATLIAGITLFAIDGGRRRKAERAGTTSRRIRIDPSPAGVRLRF